jgi:hypothetical protein
MDWSARLRSILLAGGTITGCMAKTAPTESPLLDGGRSLSPRHEAGSNALPYYEGPADEASSDEAVSDDAALDGPPADTAMDDDGSCTHGGDCCMCNAAPDPCCGLPDGPITFQGRSGICRSCQTVGGFCSLGARPDLCPSPADGAAGDAANAADGGASAMDGSDVVLDGAHD